MGMGLLQRNAAPIKAEKTAKLAGRGVAETAYRIPLIMRNDVDATVPRLGHVDSITDRPPHGRSF